MIISIEELSEIDKEMIGNKAFYLNELIQSGMNVPPGIVITDAFFFNFIEYNNIDINEVSSQIVYDSEFSCTQVELLSKKYNEIFTQDDIVVCRSSSVLEDGTSMSYAGHFETILGINGIDNLMDAIKICWAQYIETNHNLLKQIHKDEQELNKLCLPLIIQKNIESYVSGVMFVENKNGKSNIVIECSYGLGTVVVEGLVTPDQISISDNEISYQIGEKSIGNFIIKDITCMNVSDRIEHEKLGTLRVLDKDPFGNIGYVAFSNEVVKQKALDDEAIKKLKKLADSFENKALDIEWTIDIFGNLYVLQKRPITKLIHKTRMLENGVGSGASGGIAVGRVTNIKNNVKNTFVENRILVCHTTTPVHLDLIYKSKGVISEQGGFLSHTAIVCRELGIPCIIGYNDATNRFLDEDYIKIDGYLGTVEYISYTSEGDNGERTSINTYDVTIDQAVISYEHSLWFDIIYGENMNDKTAELITEKKKRSFYQINKSINPK